jgi:hypothetical protein
MRRSAALQVPDVDAIHADGAAVDIVEAHQQVDEGRLAGAGQADDRDHPGAIASDMCVR